MQMADAEVLLDDISDLGYGFVAQDFKLSELGGGGVLAHDAILDLVESQEVPVRLACVALIGVDLFDLLFGMATESGAISQVIGIVHRGRREGGGQHKSVAG